ncbi:hypothetical protein Skr01_05950 [Sphaerisporangium krabiense]|nr:hypothetical protein Skr01_05950 [Sphaerisporangium krabiense]
MDDGADPLHGPRQHRRVGDVARHRLVRAALDRDPVEKPQRVPVRRESLGQASADTTRRAGNENSFRHAQIYSAIFARGRLPAPP